MNGDRTLPKWISALWPIVLSVVGLIVVWATANAQVQTNTVDLKEVKTEVQQIEYWKIQHSVEYGFLQVELAKINKKLDRLVEKEE